MPAVRRSISTVRDIKGIEQVLKERREAPRPAFTTLNYKQTETRPEHIPSFGTKKPQPRGRSSSAARGSSTQTATKTTQSVAAQTLTLRTPAPVSNVVANSNLAMLVVRDVTRQQDSMCSVEQSKAKEQALASIDRRYNMIVDEVDLTQRPTFGENEARRLVKPVTKGGLRSEYYIPNRKHTMTELRQSIAVSREKVRKLGGPVSSTLTAENAKDIVDFIGKGGKALGAVALVNKMFAAAVDLKLAEADLTDVATSDERLRMLKCARAGVAAIPKAFFNAIRVLRTDPPTKVMVALRLVVLVLEADTKLVANPAFDGVAATFAFRSRIENGTEHLVSQLIAYEPANLPKEVVEAIRNNYPHLEELVTTIAEYNPHAGALVRWVHTILVAR